MSTTPTPNPKPKKKSKPAAFSDVLQDWDSLLNAVADNTPDLASVEPHRSALATSLGKARAAKAVQESHVANRQSTTQSLKEILVEGKDQAIRLRGAIRAALGPTTEQLTQFGIPPLRRRPLRHKPDPPTPPPSPQPEVQTATAVPEK
jgi:hypothetical protein